MPFCRIFDSLSFDPVSFDPLSRFWPFVAFLTPCSLTLCRLTLGRLTLFRWIGKIMQFRGFVWILHSSVWIVFDHFLFIDATDRRKISCDRYRIQFRICTYPLSFITNTSCNSEYKWSHYISSPVFSLNIE